MEKLAADGLRGTVSSAKEEDAQAIIIENASDGSDDEVNHRDVGVEFNDASCQQLLAFEECAPTLPPNRDYLSALMHSDPRAAFDVLHMGALFAMEAAEGLPMTQAKGLNWELPTVSYEQGDSLNSAVFFIPSLHVPIARRQPIECEEKKVDDILNDRAVRQQYRDILGADVLTAVGRKQYAPAFKRVRVEEEDFHTATAITQLRTDGAALMEELRLAGNALFSSDPLKASELYEQAMQIYENPSVSASDRSLEEYTKSAGNALTCLYKVSKFDECAILARRALRFNPILAKANAFLGRCAFEDPRVLTTDESSATPLLFLCRAIYELPALEESARPYLDAVISKLLSDKKQLALSPKQHYGVHVERGTCGNGVVADEAIPPFAKVSDMRTVFSVACYEETEGKGCCLCCGLAIIEHQPSLRCSTCDLAYYCSPSCQAQYRARHDSEECKRFLKLKEMTAMIAERQMDVPDEFFEIAAHCITTFSGIKCKWDHYERVLELESHAQEVVQNLHPIGSLLKDLFGAEVDASDVNNIIGIVRCNSLELSDASGLGVGQALHGASITCLFNHSCSPNCAIDPMQRAIVTTRSIKPGEDLTISYMPQLYWPRKLRQESLSTHYFFTCRCKRCEGAEIDEFEKALQMELPNAREGSTRKYHVMAHEACSEVRSLPVDAITDGHIKRIESLYEEMQKHLFPFHYLCHELRNTLSFVYAVKGKAAECLDCCLAELLMWECIVPGGLPVKQLKVRNALECLQGGESAATKSTGAPLLPHLSKIALLYDVAEVDEEE